MDSDMEKDTVKPTPPAEALNQDSWARSRGHGLGSHGREWAPNRGRGRGNNGASRSGEANDWGVRSGRGHLGGNSNRGRGHGNSGGSLVGEEDGEMNNIRGHFRGRVAARGSGHGGESWVKDGKNEDGVTSRGRFRGKQSRGRSRGRGRRNVGLDQGAEDGLPMRRTRRKHWKENVQEMETETEVEVQEETCICCTVTSPKYKCPTCYLKYCSVPCYKSHKEIGPCVKPEDSAAAKTRTPVANSGRTPYLFPTENTVPLEKLALLTTGENLDRLKHFLSSKKVRDFILRLDNVEENTADSEFKAVMACPEFAEFAAFATQVLNSDEEESDDEN